MSETENRKFEKYQNILIQTAANRINTDPLPYACRDYPCGDFEDLRCCRSSLRM